MFDMRTIGRRISTLRKEKDMTQMELSDRLGISHQAVSKWERGESMPDISALPLLAGIFHTSVDTLLESGDNRGHGSVVVESVLNGTAGAEIDRGAITLADGGEAAPILKPNQLDAMVPRFENVSIGELCGIAPFISQNVLDRLAEKAAEVNGVGELCGIAPFVSREVLDKLAERVAEVSGIGELCGIAPFLSRGLLDRLAEKAVKAGRSGD